MQQPSTFTVYNASAGSGKTFTLVKEYLKILLQSENIFLFQKILAVTFTNKAAGEMKERVLNNLQEFSEGKKNDLVFIILDEIPIDFANIKNRSKKILDAILQNYTSFSITTIDSFTHKIIKTFAFDLGLSLNFEVEMDAISLLEEAVDVLISKIGTDKDITNLLIQFSLDKADEDKSWDISRELHEISRILLQEDDAKNLKQLSKKHVTDFLLLKEKLKLENETIEKEFLKIVKEATSLLKANSLETSDFAYTGEYVKHFLKFKEIKHLKSDAIKFNGRLHKTIAEGKNLYAGKTSLEAKACIENLTPELHALYYSSEQLYQLNYGTYLKNRLILKNIIPLAILNNINRELSTIKEDNNIRLNAEFNHLIANHIKDQPAPYIYERIGQRFMHYFIDEMQDTSSLQWKNLTPLIDNALAQESSSLLLVGDGKQAIYRWRGGKAEQFINLSTTNPEFENPFQVTKTSKSLDTNFRSFQEIITFNNSFFQHSANFLQKESYKNLYAEGNRQKHNTRKGGHVSLTFLEKIEDAEENALKYPIEVLKKIKSIEQEFDFHEICVLVRKRSDGIAVANHLSENDIPIISSETLLLKNDNKVLCIVHLFHLIVNPTDKETLFAFLYFLHDHLSVDKRKHSFIATFLERSLPEVFAMLSDYDISFDLKKFQELPFYEKAESIIRSFKLTNTSNAYLQYFLDVVIEQQRKGVDMQGFLEFWDRKQDTLSIIAPEGGNAVQIMTVHKSKGLEFPIVIFPCDLNIYQQINPVTWLTKLSGKYNNFNALLVSFTKEFEQIDASTKKQYQQHREELELDNFNLLYVALTRPVEQLHIITEKRLSKNTENTNYYSGIFIHFLKELQLWKAETNEYTFGDSTRKSKRENIKKNSTTLESFISSPWQEHNIRMLASASKLWETAQEKAIAYGNLLHEMLSKIDSEADVLVIIERYTKKGIIDRETKITIEKILEKIVNHPMLQAYFVKNKRVFNEREIVTKDHEIIIPDRLVMEENKITIIDYKTGNPSMSHHQQVRKYGTVLESMGFTIHKRLLVYINEEILVEEV